MCIKFGPAGNADSFTAAGYKATVDAPQWLASLGLQAYEYQCGRGIHVKEDTAKKIGEQAKQYDITLSLHAPYYINLSSCEPERMEKNISYVLGSCQIARALDAQHIVVHCGGVGKQSRDKAFANTIQNVQAILAATEQAGYSQTICLETMGKQSVIGSAEEICTLTALDDRLLPCIDFGHLNARTVGKCNSYEAFCALFDLMENKIGLARTQHFHSHFSKIEYTQKGEMRHLTFADTVYGPEFAPLARVLAERGYQPVIICESAGTQAEDALAMQHIYQDALEKYAK